MGAQKSRGNHKSKQVSVLKPIKLFVLFVVILQAYMDAAFARNSCEELFGDRDFKEIKMDNFLESVQGVHNQFYEYIRSTEHLLQEHGVEFTTTNSHGEFLIAPVKGKHKLNTLAFSLHEKLGVVVMVDLMSNVKNQAEASFTPGENTLRLPMGAVMHGEVGPVTLHEITHAYMSKLEKDGVDSLFHGLRLAAKPVKGRAYGQYMSFQEVATFAKHTLNYARSLKKSLKEESKEKINGMIEILKSSSKTAVDLGVNINEINMSFSAARMLFAKNPEKVKMEFDIDRDPKSGEELGMIKLEVAEPNVTIVFVTVEKGVVVMLKDPMGITSQIQLLDMGLKQGFQEMLAKRDPQTNAIAAELVVENINLWMTRAHEKVNTLDELNANMSEFYKKLAEVESKEEYKDSEVQDIIEWASQPRKLLGPHL